MKALSKLNECDLFIVHQCDVKGCKENLVIDRSFDNNMECCMAKERLVGIMNMIPFLDFLGRSERQNLGADHVKTITKITKN